MKKIIQHKKIKGFSLVETLIYVAIFGLLVFSLNFFLATLHSTRLNSQVTLEVNSQGSRIIKLITQSIRDSAIINNPVNSNSGDTTTITSQDAIVTTFFAQDGVLYIEEGSSDPVALTNNRVTVTDLVFSNLTAPDTSGSIKISFELHNSTSTSRIYEQYSKKFYGSATIR